MSILHPNGTSFSVSEALDETVAIDSFSRLLTEGIERVTTKDGRLDTKDLAAYVLREMKNSSGKP